MGPRGLQFVEVADVSRVDNFLFASMCEKLPLLSFAKPLFSEYSEVLIETKEYSFWAWYNPSSIKFISIWSA